jgi:hypothetical protein
MGLDEFDVALRYDEEDDEEDDLPVTGLNALTNLDGTPDQCQVFGQACDLSQSEYGS